MFLIKGKVDAVDMCMGKYTTKWKIKEWPLNTFSYMLGTVTTTANTIFNGELKA